jgi:hypothetical protein
MEIYYTKWGGVLFQHDDPTNDGRFTPSLYYYVTWVDLPADYYNRG